MIAGAVQRYLQAAGLNPVRLTSAGDYQPGAGAVYVVWSEERADVRRLGQRDRDAYRAGLQLRVRHDNEPMAVECCRRAMDLIRALAGERIAYTLPDGSTRAYDVIGVRHVNGPSPYPQPPGAGGYMATSNYQLTVREVE